MPLPLALLTMAVLAAEPGAREKALELLDGSAQTAAGAQPEVAASAIMRVAENYDSFDHKRALELMKDAFAVTAAIPLGSDGHQITMQARIAAAMAPLSLPDAIEMVRQVHAENGSLDSWRQNAIQSIVTGLLGKKQIDQSIGLVNGVGSAGQYPFAAARQIFEKLPPDNDRRLALFSYAMAAYALRPGPDFAQFLAHHWKELPRSTAEAAITSVVKNILDSDDDRSVIRRYYGPKPFFAWGTRVSVILLGRRDIQLFDVLSMVRTIDQKRFDEILGSRPELKAALALYPEGRLSMGDEGSLGMDESLDLGQAALRSGVEAQTAQTMKKVTDLVLGADDNLSEADSARLLDKLLQIAKTISDPETQVETLAEIAGEVGVENLTIGKKIISDCIDILKDVKDLPVRVGGWNNLAEAADRMKDDQMAWKLFDRALADCTELYKIDTDADLPNKGLRDTWPSTNAFRKVVIAATKIFGVNAEPLLSKVIDPDLALFARVEMAQTLLERPHENRVTSFAPKKP